MPTVNQLTKHGRAVLAKVCNGQVFGYMECAGYLTGKRKFDRF